MANKLRSYQGKQPKLAASVFVDETALVIGDVDIGENSSVWPMTVLRGDVNYIRIGKGTNIQDGTVVHVAHKGEYGPGYPTIIGDDVTVGHKALIHACTIGDRVLVGMGAIIMDGAVVEDDVVIAAGALVSPGKTLQSGFLYRGSPAVQARPLSDKEKQHLKYSAEHYVLVKQSHEE